MNKKGVAIMVNYGLLGNVLDVRECLEKYLHRSYNQKTVNSKIVDELKSLIYSLDEVVDVLKPMKFFPQMAMLEYEIQRLRLKSPDITGLRIYLELSDSKNKNIELLHLNFSSPFIYERFDEQFKTLSHE